MPGRAGVPRRLKEMAKKKQVSHPVSQEDSEQAQRVLEQYHQIANELHTVKDQEQVETALAAITTLPESAQFALLKALAKEHHTDAADVLLAINEVSPLKSVRKEARRSLIQLQGARIYPQWEPPARPSLVVQPVTPPQSILGSPSLDEEEETDLDEAEQDEEDSDLRDLPPQEVVTTFVESLVDGDYDTAYDLLSSESPLREGLSRDEWIERRENWVDEANPGDLEPSFIREREPQQSGLWLPFGISRSSGSKEIEAGWSMEMDETPVSETLPELPKATAVYEETQRHWFWASYTLVQEEGAWRIQNMIDEATHAQGLPIEELQKRVQELDQYLEEFRQKYTVADLQQFTEADSQRSVEEMFWRAMRGIGYIDALIKKTPLDRTLYEQAAARMVVFNQLERSLVYLEPLARLFEEERAASLRALAEVQQRLSDKYFDIGDDKIGERLQELAVEALNESLTIEDNIEAHISLAELLIEDDRLDEAEEHLLRAKAMTTDPSEEAHIEMHLGEIATGREQYEEALHHYQRAAELAPNSPDSWVDLARAYEKLDNLEEAEANYRRAIELEPGNEDLYYALSKMYSEHGQPTKAIEAIEDGLSANPDSAILSVYLASMYLENKEYRQAEIFLDKAERLDPKLGMISMFREVLKLEKALAAPKIGKLSGPKPKKKKRKR
jgi:tetratricopeptide (TPR) repeat protein